MGSRPPVAEPCVACVLQILDEIGEHGIRIYQLPDADSDEDEEFKEQTRVLKVRLHPVQECVCEGRTSSACAADTHTLPPLQA